MRPPMKVVYCVVCRSLGFSAWLYYRAQDRDVLKKVLEEEEVVTGLKYSEAMFESLPQLHLKIFFYTTLVLDGGGYSGTRGLYEGSS